MKTKLSKIDKIHADYQKKVKLNPEPKNIKDNTVKRLQIKSVYSSLSNKKSSTEYQNNRTINQFSNIKLTDLENSSTYNNYGVDAFIEGKKLERIIIFKKDYLKRHNINSSYRTIIVDWMMEVVHVFKCEPETVFLSVSIMDLFINVSECNISEDDLHLICITAIYMASKIEDVAPLTVHSIVHKILDKKFQNKSIVLMEITIFNAINYNVLLVSTYEFIKTYIYDFIQNNRSEDDENLIQISYIKKLEVIAIYLAKIMLHEESYYQYKCSVKAISCLTLGLDILRTNYKKINSVTCDLIKCWLIFLLRQNEFNPDYVKFIHDKLSVSYENLYKIEYINNSLEEFLKIE